jgi:hypothetical protein
VGEIGSRDPDLGDLVGLIYATRSFPPELQVQDIDRPIAAVIAVVITTSLPDLAGPEVQPGRATSRRFANNNFRDRTCNQTSLGTAPRCPSSWLHVQVVVQVYLNRLNITSASSQPALVRFTRWIYLCLICPQQARSQKVQQSHT